MAAISDVTAAWVTCAELAGCAPHGPHGLPAVRRANCSPVPGDSDPENLLTGIFGVRGLTGPRGNCTTGAAMLSVTWVGGREAAHLSGVSRLRVREVVDRSDHLIEAHDAGRRAASSLKRSSATHLFVTPEFTSR